MHDDELTIAVIDDLESAQLGTQLMIERTGRARVVATMTFEEALTWRGWPEVDYVVCDVADDSGEDTNFPAIGVITHIREASGDAPRIIAVTGHPYAFDEDIIRRRVAEAKVDHFVRRQELEHLLRLLGTEGDLRSSLEGLPQPSAPEEIPELGIMARTQVNKLIDVLERPPYQSLLDRARQRRADERTSEKLRAAAAAAAGTLQAVDAEGNPVARTPRVEQLRRIFNSATRFPHHPKRRAARP